MFCFGAATKQEQLDFNQPVVCTHGRYGNYTVLMEYTSSIFYPLSWNKILCNKLVAVSP